MSLQAELNRAHLARRAGWSAKSVPDDGIDLKRRNDTPQLVIKSQSEEIHSPSLQPEQPFLAIEEAKAAVEECLGDGDELPKPVITIDDILRAVCGYYKISKIDLLSARRTAPLVLPRQVAMYLSRTLTLRSLPFISKRMGGRDHTTAMHAVRKIEALLQHDSKLQNDVRHLLAVLTEARYSAWPAAEEEAVPA